MTLLALLGAVVGGIVVWRAPGNGLRFGELHTTGSLTQLLLPTIEAAGRAFLVVTSAPKVVPLAAGVGLAIGLALPRRAVPRPWLTVGLVIVAVPVLAYGALAASTYAGITAGDRVLITVAAVLVAAAMTVGLIAGTHLPSLLRPLGAPSLVVGTALLSLAMPPLAYPLDNLDHARSVAAAWDARDREIRGEVAAGSSRVHVVPIVSGLGLRDMETAWVDGCAGVYYGAILTPG
jgi:hypothetical protein